MAAKKHTKEVRAIFKASRIGRKKGRRLSQSVHDRLNSRNEAGEGTWTPKMNALLADVRKAGKRVKKLKTKYYARRKVAKK
jgi:hypothetical protein